jgi:hypothetical protein
MLSPVSILQSDWFRFLTFLFETGGAFPVSDFVPEMHKRGCALLKSKRTLPICLFRRIPLRFLGAVATMCCPSTGNTDLDATFGALKCLILLVTIAR